MTAASSHHPDLAVGQNDTLPDRLLGVRVEVLERTIARPVATL